MLRDGGQDFKLAEVQHEAGMQACQCSNSSRLWRLAHCLALARRR